MNPRLKFALTVLSLMLLTLLVSSCEDGVLTPSEGQFSAIANPSTVVIDVFNEETQGQTSIEAQLFAANDIPIRDAEVRFFTTGGKLASVENLCLGARCSISNSVCVVDEDCPAAAPRVMMTDSSGIARDVLVLFRGGSSSNTVTARSGSLEATAVVTLDEDFGPDAPEAVIDITPEGSQVQGVEVRFDGGGSIADDLITCYHWTVDPEIDPAIDEYNTDSELRRSFAAVQTLDISLEISVDPDIDCSRSAPTPDPNLFSPDFATATYEIVCDRTDPVADAGGPYTAVTLSSGSVDVTVDGSQSEDPDSTITGWAWDCDTGSSDGGNVSGETAVCTYTTAGTKTIRLTVTNGCTDTAIDTASVTVNSP